MSQSVLPCPSLTEQQLSSLWFSFRVSSSGQAVGLASELRTIGAQVSQVREQSSELPGREDWVVTLTTPPATLTLAVLQRWEGEMLAVEQRWPGCRFLGWRTCRASEASSSSAIQMPQATTSSTAATLARNAGGARQRSQRELVTASLLRCPPADCSRAVRTSCGPR